MPMDEIKFALEFEKYRYDDNLLANAYEKADIDVKAAIKSAIALHFEVEIQPLPMRTMRTKGAFVLHEEVKAKRASIYIVNENFTSPAELIAAVMPAILAKSNVVLLARYRMSEEMLLSLELMGIEDIFLIEEYTEVEVFIERLYKDYLSINCISLGFEHALSHYTSKKSIAFLYYDKKAVVVGNSKLFEKAYPSLHIYKNIDEIDKDKVIDTALVDAIDKNSITYPIVLVGEGLEFYTRALFPLEYFLERDRMFIFAEE